MEYTKQRSKQDSPMFAHNFVSIAAAASYILTIRDAYPASRKYPVINWLEVVNDDVVNVDVEVDGEIYRLPAKNVRTITKPNISTINIINRDAATATTTLLIRATWKYNS